MKRYPMRAASIVALAFASFVACGPSKPTGAEYLGKWEATWIYTYSTPSTSFQCPIDVSRNGTSFLITVEGAYANTGCKEYGGLFTLTPEGNLQGNGLLFSYDKATDRIALSAQGKVQFLKKRSAQEQVDIAGSERVTITELKLGKDRAATERTSSYAPYDTLYAVAEVSSPRKIRVTGQLLVDSVEGQMKGPIQGLETAIDLGGTGPASFNFSPPTNGWPKGKYSLEVLLTDEAGVQKDTKAISLTVY
jgi:hypothetical protein